ncbi:hypothetical protein NTH44_003135 [Vibrio metoecus]
MDTAKKALVEQFISGCQELGLSVEESVDLAARNLIGAVTASGKSYANNVGVVEVEC